MGLWEAEEKAASALEKIDKRLDEHFNPAPPSTPPQCARMFSDVLKEFLEGVRSANEIRQHSVKAAEPFKGSTGYGLLWFLQNVLSPLTQWAGNDLAPAALNLVANAIKAINSVVNALKPRGIQDNGGSSGNADVLARMDNISDRLASLEKAILDRPVNLYTDDRKIAQSSNRGNRLLGRTAPTA